MNHIGSSLDEGSGTDLFGRENKTHVVSKLLAQSIFVAGCLSEKKNFLLHYTPEWEKNTNKPKFDTLVNRRKDLLSYSFF